VKTEHHHYHVKDDNDDDNDDDDDDVPFTPRLSPISSFATCNCKHDAPVVMWDTTIMSVQRVFDNNNSLLISVKKSNVTSEEGEN
jgi:hypothetical protein